METRLLWLWTSTLPGGLAVGAVVPLDHAGVHAIAEVLAFEDARVGVRVLPQIYDPCIGPLGNYLLHERQVPARLKGVLHVGSMIVISDGQHRWAGTVTMIDEQPGDELIYRVLLSRDRMWPVMNDEPTLPL